jgi:hypothetical protein
MTTQFSFTKYEHEVLPTFRQKINKAESTEDVKKFFVYTAIDLLENIFEGKMNFEYEDVALLPDSKSQFAVSERIFSSEQFKSVWNNSDLPRVICRFALSAIHRHRHLEKHPEKTDAKIRM